jgi:hypothetical protein
MLRAQENNGTEGIQDLGLTAILAPTKSLEIN